MKNHTLILVLFLIQPVLIFGQCPDDERIIKKLADGIVERTDNKFVHKKTKIVLDELNPDVSICDIKLSSPYTDWKYWNGVLNIGLLKYAEFSGDNTYKEKVIKNYEFALKQKEFFSINYPKGANRWHHPFGLFTRIDELDDCGAMGAGLIEVYKEKPNKNYEEYIYQAADHMMNKQHRLDDGTVVRAFPRQYTLWADDLYMSIVFLSRMGSLTGEHKYFDDAAKQVINFTKYIFNQQNQLYYHCYYSKDKRNGVAHWGRSNGWVMFAQTELLERLPDNHPQRDTLISILEQQIIGVSRYQAASGLWHQLLDKEDSYLEASVTAMFTYAIAKGINNGWVDKRYSSIVKNAWKGIKTRINEKGKVEGICAGTGIDESLSYYYNRPTPLHDIHGLGVVLLAGIEILNFK